LNWETAVVAGTFELLAVLIVSAVLTPDVVELGRMSQVDGGRAEESKLNDDESNTDDDDNDDVNGLKMPADGEEDPKENGDDWSVVPKYSNTERYQYVAKKDDDSEVRFALRLCQSSTLKIAFIPFAHSTALMYVLVRTMGYSTRLSSLLIVRGSRRFLIDITWRENRQSGRDLNPREVENVMRTPSEIIVLWKKTVSCVARL
jgi:hypothetical protein